MLDSKKKAMFASPIYAAILGALQGQNILQGAIPGSRPMFRIKQWFQPKSQGCPERHQAAIEKRARKNAKRSQNYYKSRINNDCINQDLTW